MTATNDQISYAEFTLTVPANSSVPIERQSDFVACLSSTADFKIRLNNSPSAFFTAGLTVEPIGGLESVQVVNDTATPLTVTLAFGRGNIRDSRVTLNANQILPTRESAPDLLNMDATLMSAGQYTLIKAANTLRKNIILQNSGGDMVLIVPSQASGASGYQLMPGAALSLDTASAIYGYGGTGYVRSLECAWSA